MPLKEPDFVKLRPGWLMRQMKNAEEDFKTWPEWMQREARKHSILGIKTSEADEEKLKGKT